MCWRRIRYYEMKAHISMGEELVLVKIIGMSADVHETHESEV